MAWTKRGNANAGKSAYELWLDLGNTGTVQDFINSLVGPAGPAGSGGSGSSSSASPSYPAYYVPNPELSAQSPGNKVYKNWTVQQYYDMYDALMDKYPKYVRRDIAPYKDMSNTYELRRYIFEPEFGYEKTIYIGAGMHGTEMAGKLSLARICQLVCEEWQSSSHLTYLRNHVRIIVNPVANPWGHANLQLTNSNSSANTQGKGTNCNRNYDAFWPGIVMSGGADHNGGAPFSENESKWVRDTILFFGPENFHYGADFHDAPDSKTFGDFWINYNTFHQSSAKATRDLVWYLAGKYATETKQINKLTVTSGASSSGVVTVTLNQVPIDVSVLAGDDIAAVAAKIRSTSFAGWVLTGSSAEIIFTATTTGYKSTLVFNGKTTGSTATASETVRGAPFIWHDKDTMTSGVFPVWASKMMGIPSSTVECSYPSAATPFDGPFMTKAVDTYLNAVLVNTLADHKAPVFSSNEEWFKLDWWKAAANTVFNMGMNFNGLIQLWDDLISAYPSLVKKSDTAVTTNDGLSVYHYILEPKRYKKTILLVGGRTEPNRDHYNFTIGALRFLELLCLHGNKDKHLAYLRNNVRFIIVPYLEYGTKYLNSFGYWANDGTPNTSGNINISNIVSIMNGIGTIDGVIYARELNKTDILSAATDDEFVLSSFDSSDRTGVGRYIEYLKEANLNAAFGTPYSSEFANYVFNKRNINCVRIDAGLDHAMYQKKKYQFDDSYTDTAVPVDMYLKMNHEVARRVTHIANVAKLMTI